MKTETNNLPLPETANTSAANEFLSSRLVVAEVEQVGGGMCVRCAKSFDDCTCLTSHNYFRA